MLCTNFFLLVCQYCYLVAFLSYFLSVLFNFSYKHFMQIRKCNETTFSCTFLFSISIYFYKHIICGSRGAVKLPFFSILFFGSWVMVKWPIPYFTIFSNILWNFYVLKYFKVFGVTNFDAISDYSILIIKNFYLIKLMFVIIMYLILFYVIVKYILNFGYIFLIVL